MPQLYASCQPYRRSVAGYQLLLTGLVTIILPILLAGCQKKSVIHTAGQPVPVRVTMVSTRPIPIELSNIGVVQPLATVTLQSQVNGRLAAVLVKPGENVKKGEVLFKLDSAPFQAAVLQAQATYLKDKATANNSSVIADQERQMLKLKAASPTEYLQAKYTAQAAAAQVKADQALIQTAKINLAYCTIQSPMDGQAGNRLAFTGQTVQTTTNLLVINQMQPIYVAFSLPQSNLYQILQARKSTPRLPILVQTHGRLGPALHGYLSFIDNSVNAATGSIQLMGTFANRNKMLWPGEYVNATLRVGLKKNAIVVPTTAVEVGQDGSYVYIVGKHNVAQMQTVTEAFSYDNLAVISKGLSVGQTVITDGQLSVIPGKPVDIVKNGLVSPAAGRIKSPVTASSQQATSAPAITKAKGRP